MKKILFFISFIIILNESTQAIHVDNQSNRKLNLLLFNRDFQDHISFELKPGIYETTANQKMQIKYFFDRIQNKLKGKGVDSTVIIPSFPDTNVEPCTGTIEVKKGEDFENFYNILIKIGSRPKEAAGSSCSIETP